MPELTERVDRLEEAIMELVYIQHKTEMEIQNLKKEMKEFKDEMMREVKRINKQWGELANKMGTIVEDIVFPAARPVIRKYFKCEPEDLMMNVERKREGEREEFDIIGACKDKVFLIEVKSSIRPEHAKQIKKKVERLFKFFPEYAGREVIPVLASLSIKGEILNTLTREGIYGMAYKEWEYMDILNFEDIQSRA